MNERILFRNGGVFDGHSHHRDTAVLVDGSRIVAVGPETELAREVRGPVQVLDLAGGLLLPGFQDAHVHPVQGGLERLRCDLSGLGTRQEYLAAVADHAAAHPEQGWVIGGGWSLSAFGPRGPTAADLDGVVPDRPVYLLNRDHHGAWVNGEALRRAGLHRGTPDPVDGRLERQPDGAPTGVLHEGAMSLVGRLLPATTSQEYYAAFLVAQEYLHSLGVTAWQDAILGDYAGIDDPAPTYLRASASGDLTARVRGALWWDRGRGLEQVPELVERRRALTVDRLSAGSVKVMQDGIAENYTAAMTAPYLDGCGCATTNTGLSFVEPEVLREAVTRLDAEGFQVHVHAIGDRAVREALDSFDTARRANGVADLRHHIAHIQFVHPDDRSRFGALGVTANMQPLWAVLDEQMTDLTIPYVGEDRAAWQYPFADLAAAGAPLAAGSDWPVSTPDPLQGIHVAVNRRLHDDPGRGGVEVFLPHQALRLQQAFAAYTSGSARVNHHDDAGILAAGRVADLAVLDRDPFLGDAGEVGSARVVATYVEGRVVYTA